MIQQSKIMRYKNGTKSRANQLRTHLIIPCSIHILHEVFHLEKFNFKNLIENGDYFESIKISINDVDDEGLIEVFRVELKVDVLGDYGGFIRVSNS